LDALNLVQHIVVRLADSLPAGTREDIAKMRREDRVLAADGALDQGYGRRELAVPLVAALVQTALLTFDAERYVLTAWCVMPNHLHALLEVRSGYGLDQILHSWKSYTYWGVPGRSGHANISIGSCATTNISPEPRLISRETQ
jgi:hypothetical protein